LWRANLGRTALNQRGRICERLLKGNARRTSLGQRQLGHKGEVRL